MIDRNNDPRKGMKVPDNFFETFEDRLMVNIDLNPKQKNLWTRPWLMGAAAVFALVLAAVIIMKINVGERPLEFSDLNQDEKWDYLLENLDDVTYEDLYSFEESADVILSLEEELYDNTTTEDLLQDVDLETITTLYE